MCDQCIEVTVKKFQLCIIVHGRCSGVGCHEEESCGLSQPLHSECTPQMKPLCLSETGNCSGGMQLQEKVNLISFQDKYFNPHLGFSLYTELLMNCIYTKWKIGGEPGW